VDVTDSRGVHRFAGAEIRIYRQDPGSSDARAEGDPQPEGGERGELLGTGILDTGGGYCSQGVTPVHFGIPPGVRQVTVEITLPDGGSRRVHTVEGVPIPMRPFQVLKIRLPEVF
jgi:hypothetical protein